MSYNGSGVFVINSTGQPVSANTLIEAATFNAFTADVATGLSTAITKDGQTTVTANLPMGGFKLTGLGAAAVAGDAVRYEQVGALNTAAIGASASKETPVDADMLQLYDSAATTTNTKLSWANLKATLKTYFDTLYSTISLAVANTWTGAQRGTITTDNDASFDQSVTNNFSCTPTGAAALTFTNHTAGQSGLILFVNGSNYAITAAATTYIAAADLAKLSATGTYLIAYLDNGTNAYCTVTAALTSAGA